MNSPKIKEVYPNWSLHVDPTCHALTSLLPVSPGDARFAVMAPTLPKPCVAVEGIAALLDRRWRRQVVHEAFPSSPPASLSSATRLLSFSSLRSPWTAFEATRARRTDSRAPLHEFQIHFTRSSSTSLATFPTPPILATTPASPGIGGSPAASH